MSPARRPIIALVTEVIYPYHHGGREIRYYELSRRLARVADIHIYTMRWWSGPRVRADETVTYHAISPLFSLYTGNRRSISQAVLFGLASLRLLTCRFDVLEADHIPYFQLFALRFVATLRRKRFLVTWHEVWGLAYWREYLGPLGLVAWVVEFLAMHLPDHIIAASPETAEKLRAILGESAAITVAPSGIDIDAANDACPDTALTDLVVVSRLLAHKRIDMLLDAIATLHGEGTPVSCRIIGDGPERPALLEHVRKLGVAHAVDFRHDVHEQNEVYALLKAAKVFVFPSDREGYGLAALEALACGLSVITTSAPANLAQYLVTQSPRGVVCDASASAVAAAIKDVIATAERPSGEHANSVDPWLTDHTWDATADRVAGALLTCPNNVNIPRQRGIRRTTRSATHLL
jgi:glycosyltransferase involved in cell wall biosynthesis